MRLYLASTSDSKWDWNVSNILYALESFYYFKPWQSEYIHKWKGFLLDSGAFTFMSTTAVVDWDDYLSRYIAFINFHNIKYFFELDIDSIVGYEKVKKLRERLEYETGKQCIPVWHKSRGLEEYISLCEQYRYIAIGGLVTKEIPKKQYNYLKKLTALAEYYGTKVHGLGFTNMRAYDYGFYSVDSTNWKSGRRFGQIHRFENGTIKIYYPPKGKRVGSYREVDTHNLAEWIKYQKYLDERK